MGRHQFDFMVAEGLQPGHRLLDVGCGALRGGVHYIPYLDVGHYYGVDADDDLIDAGLLVEAPAAGVDASHAHFHVTEDFDVDHWATRFDMAIAQSVFTHLPYPKVAQAFTMLRPWVDRFYATYWPMWTGRRFSYDSADLEELADGWSIRAIGDWGHPRGQHIAEFT